MRTSIDKKLIGSFVVGVLFALVLLGWSLFTIEGLLNTMKKMETLSIRVDKTNALNFNIQKLIKISDEYMLTGDIKKRDEFDRLITELADILSVLEEQKGDERWDEMSRKVKQEVTKLSEMVVEIMFIDNPIGNSKATELMRKVTALGERLIKDIERFNTIASEDRDRLALVASRMAARTRLVVYTFPVVGLVLLSILYVYLKRYISRPLMELYSGAERVSRGDYTHPVIIKTGDELEHLADGFNKMADALREREEKLFSLLKVVEKVNRELISATEYKSRFLANVSHELKTPLTHILGFSELLKLEESDKLSGTAKNYVDNIYRSGKSLLKLIEDILHVARTTIEDIAPDRRKFSIRNTINRIVAKLRPQADSRGQTIRVEIEKDVDMIMADEGMIAQIIGNLLDNAVKFTPQGGTITIRARREPRGDTDTLTVSVTDTGIGIKPELKDHIFELFEIGEKGMVREYEGLGIGLALARKLVEYHGGQIWCESELGKGSTFEFYIPLERTDKSQ